MTSKISNQFYQVFEVKITLKGYGFVFWGFDIVAKSKHMFQIR